MTYAPGRRLSVGRNHRTPEGLKASVQIPFHSALLGDRVWFVDVDFAEGAQNTLGANLPQFNGMNMLQEEHNETELLFYELMEETTYVIGTEGLWHNPGSGGLLGSSKWKTNDGTAEIDH